MIINSNVFLLKEVPNIHPSNPIRLQWWREQKRRIIEGHWEAGQWMPPSLYHYANFWHIRIGETKKIAKPMVRDLEWEKCRYYEEAKGFSGFEKETKYTSYRGLAPDSIEVTKILYPHIYEKYKDREYIEARKYLQMYHGVNKGRPLYENQAKNVIDIEARGGGKSYLIASFCALNFITDGAKSYQEYWDNIQANEPFSSETLVGAYDSKWSGDLLSKVKLGLDMYPGIGFFNNKTYPSPLNRKYKGSWKSGDTILAEFKIKRGSKWLDEGSRSKIQHRTFKDNPLAGNGTRPGLVALEEVGFHANLRKSLGALKECTLSGNWKFGVIWMLGTGGDMEGGSTLEAKSVFYDPEGYDCLVFDDKWEQRGSIGLFVPAHKTLNEFKNEHGNTEIDRAKKSVEIVREQALKAKDRTVYVSELQNKPEKPSEAFLTEQGSILDIVALEEQLRYVESMQHKTEYKGMYGDLIINHHGKVEFIRDIKNKLRPAPFPVKKGKQPDGCVVIWELPEVEEPPYGMYIAGTDPYDQDKAENTVSMGSTFIMKRCTINGITEEKIVAEYTGRPLLATIHHENVRKLLKFYNALDLYENEKNTIKIHFEQKKSLYLLANTPTILSTVSEDRVKKVNSGRSNKGIHMTDNQKREMLGYLKVWLETPSIEGEGKLNLHTIKSIPLLQELVDYNEEGNYDRVIAILLVILQLNQMYHVKLKAQREEVKNDYFLSLLKRARQDDFGFEYHQGHKETYLSKAREENKQFLIPSMFQ